jgi:hypothetical protein
VAGRRRHANIVRERMAASPANFERLLAQRVVISGAAGLKFNHSDRLFKVVAPRKVEDCPHLLFTGSRPASRGWLGPKGAAVRGPMTYPIATRRGRPVCYGSEMPPTQQQAIEQAVQQLRASLVSQIAKRKLELNEDDRSHHFLYRVAGVPGEECDKIDYYQNVGRFVFKYVGALVEETTKLLLMAAGKGGPKTITNTRSSSPKTFQIDCCTADQLAHEIKWRDATTDGDHRTKERTKVLSIVDAGLIPVRVAFYLPNRLQALKIQQEVIALYLTHGKAYVGPEAWAYVEAYTGVDLKAELGRFDLPSANWPVL